MNEHTPGPWKWWTSNSWRRLRADYGRDTPCVLSPFVCRDGQADLEVSEADMRLIAAAPDLRAFADSILIYIVEGDEDRVWLKFGDMVIVGIDASTAEASALLQMEAQRRAAIAKATGAAS